MKHLPQRVAALLLAAVMSLTLTGCMFRSSVEDLFTLPRVSAEYEGLSQELDDLQKQGYELVGPSTGQNIQPVQMVDLDNDGLSEALVFMRLQDDEKPLKIFVFRPEDDTYHRLCVIESSGTAIDSVQYEDLTGNGRLEIIVGWRISADVQTVAVYVPQPDPYVLLQSGYTRFTVTDLDGDGVKSLLLFRSDNDGQPVAGLYIRKDDVISASYSSVLSYTMAELSRGSVVVGKLSDGTPAVFATGVNSQGMAMTDILVWQESGGLTNIAQDLDHRPHRRRVPLYAAQAPGHRRRRQRGDPRAGDCRRRRGKRRCRQHRRGGAGAGPLDQLLRRRKPGGPLRDLSRSVRRVVFPPAGYLAGGGHLHHRRKRRVREPGGAAVQRTAGGGPVRPYRRQPGKAGHDGQPHGPQAPERRHLRRGAAGRGQLLRPGRGEPAPGLQPGDGRVGRMKIRGKERRIHEKGNGSGG